VTRALLATLLLLGPTRAWAAEPPPPAADTPTKAGAPAEPGAPAPAPSPAPRMLGASERLERARVCQAALDFPCAERELAAVRAALASLAAGEQREALQRSAEVALAAERPDDARAHLATLLALAPDFAPGAEAWPPQWRALLDEVRRAAPDRLGPTVVEVRLPVAAPPGRPLEVAVIATDPSGVGRVVLFVGGEPPLAIVCATEDGRRWVGAVPAERVTGRALRLWAEAHDVGGRGPTRWGSPEAPHVLPVAAPEPPPALAGETPWYQTWWFWTAVGVGVAAAAGVTAWALTGPEDGAAGPVTGSLALDPQWPQR
jgi:hypothetical protein